MDGDIGGYLQELAMLNRAPTTVRLRGYQLHAWASWLAAQGLTPRTASRCDVVAYLMGFIEPETRASNMAAVRGLSCWLAESGRRPDDPTRRLPTVRRPLGDPMPVPDEVVRTSLAVASPRERSMLILGRFAGLRAAEIAAAHRRYLRGGLGSETIRLRGKGARWRELPAHPLVVEVLTRAQPWVFPSSVRQGRPILPGSVTQRLGDLLPAPWTAHSLRHAFATDAYDRTHDLRLVQAWMGHADPRTTARYIRADSDGSAIRAMSLSPLPSVRAVG